jgi:DNA polymerase-3 subunit alpha
MEVLIRSGALDGLDPQGNRARMLHELSQAVQAAEQYQRDRESGQVDLFGNAGETAAPHLVTHEPVPPWTRLQTLQAEKESLGLYLTGHPVELHAQDLERFVTCFLGSVAERLPGERANQSFGQGYGQGRGRGTPMVLAGLVRAIRRRGNRGAYVAIDDHTGRAEFALFDEAWTLYADQLSRRRSSSSNLVSAGRAGSAGSRRRS